MSHALLCGTFAALTIILAAYSAKGAADDDALACDREMRRTVEAIQAWRRSHHGAYPARLVDLKNAGLLPADGAICPRVRTELAGADPKHGFFTSVKPGGDPPGTYEYEFTDTVLKSGDDGPFLPKDAPEYTRQDLKIELLRRKFWEQVPILRCRGHHLPGSEPSAVGRTRNITVTGYTYWSGALWEEVWLDDVPYCEREANVLFGLKGPPFFSDWPPTLPEAVDLRKWSCAFGDHPWWWTYPMFAPAPYNIRATDLSGFFKGQHARVARVGGEDWWLNGLVQLQGRLKIAGESDFTAPGLIAFVWEKTNAIVNRAFSTASWLQGSIWWTKKGEKIGSLVWHYSDGTRVTTPIVYGVTTARFWGEKEQLRDEKEFPQPVWTHQESAESAGRARTVRLFRQEWKNPRPNEIVATLDFVSNRESPAAPFLVAINLR